MSKPQNLVADIQDVYTLLVDVHALVAENNKILLEVKQLADTLPEAMAGIANNPMLKPFAKMLGL